MTEEELIEIEARCNAATPGTWETGIASDGSGDMGILAEIHGRLRVIGQMYAEVDAQGKDNARCIRNSSFVVHARADVPALIAEVRSWHEAMARLRDMPMASVAPSLVEIGRWVCDDLTQSVPYYGDTPQEAIAKAHEEWRRGGVK